MAGKLIADTRTTIRTGATGGAESTSASGKPTRPASRGGPGPAQPISRGTMLGLSRAGLIAGLLGHHGLARHAEPGRGTKLSTGDLLQLHLWRHRSVRWDRRRMGPPPDTRSTHRRFRSPARLSRRLETTCPPSWRWAKAASEGRADRTTTAPGALPAAPAEAVALSPAPSASYSLAQPRDAITATTAADNAPGVYAISLGGQGGVGGITSEGLGGGDGGPGGGGGVGGEVIVGGDISDNTVGLTATITTSGTSSPGIVAQSEGAGGAACRLPTTSRATPAGTRW